MNAKPLLAASLVSLLCALSLAVRAADAVQAPENRTPAAAELEPSPDEKAKQHSHLDEKVGTSSKARGSAVDKAAAGVPDKSKHNHQRDAK